MVVQLTFTIPTEKTASCQIFFPLRQLSFLPPDAPAADRLQPLFPRPEIESINLILHCKISDSRSLVPQTAGFFPDRLGRPGENSGFRKRQHTDLQMIEP
jgi:hypothetical protein